MWCRDVSCGVAADLVGLYWWMAHVSCGENAALVVWLVLVLCGRVLVGVWQDVGCLVVALHDDVVGSWNTLFI